ncbi:MAG: hypothetical protein VKL42_17705 [Snowella sp.]|nr:hypothetical protein [Snowella sp.]
MRQDIYLYNDAGGWGVLAGDVIRQIVEDNREHDEQFVFSHKAALFDLEGDDYSVIRVVANEPLTEAEEREWIARARWRLNISDGQVIICSGFDPDSIAYWLDEGDGYEVRSINIPALDYQVTLYTYLHSMNGAVWLGDRSLLPELSEWFQRDHPNASLPTRVAAIYAYEDVAPEDDWYPMRENVQSGKILIEKEPLYWIGYLIHFSPFTSAKELDQPGAYGWFESKTGLRVPTLCPLGIPTSCTEDNDIAHKVEWSFEDTSI